jgi:hypothetical protein
MDAYMRGFEVVVASDCVASERPRQKALALEQMRAVVKARTAPSARIVLARRKSGRTRAAR